MNNAAPNSWMHFFKTTKCKSDYILTQDRHNFKYWTINQIGILLLNRKGYLIPVSNDKQGS